MMVWMKVRIAHSGRTRNQLIQVPEDEAIGLMRAKLADLIDQPSPPLIPASMVPGEKGVQRATKASDARPRAARPRRNTSVQAGGSATDGGPGQPGGSEPDEGPHAG